LLLGRSIFWRKKQENRILSFSPRSNRNSSARTDKTDYRSAVRKVRTAAHRLPSPSSQYDPQSKRGIVKSRLNVSDATSLSIEKALYLGRIYREVGKCVRSFLHVSYDFFPVRLDLRSSSASYFSLTKHVLSNQNSSWSRKFDIPWKSKISSCLMAQSVWSHWIVQQNWDIAKLRYTFFGVFYAYTYSSIQGVWMKGKNEAIDDFAWVTSY